MEVRRYTSAAEFLDATRSFRSDDPVRTSLITSIASSVANGSRTYDAYFWLAVIDFNLVQGIAIRTAPFGFVFSPMSNSATEALFSFISIEDPTVKEFAGPKIVIDYLEQVSGRSAVDSESELIYENRHLIAAPARGDVRLATDPDFELIINWMKIFVEEVGISGYNLEGIVRDNLSHGRYFLLYVGDAIVSFGGHTDNQYLDGQTISRVGPIFTPLEHRKKGYASSITSAITQKLLSEGALATLYTQAGNPTSNKIYQEIGYTLVDENRRIVLS